MEERLVKGEGRGRDVTSVEEDHERKRAAGEAAATSSQASRKHDSPDCEGLGEPRVVRKGSANAGHDCVLQQDAEEDHPGHLQET